MNSVKKKPFTTHMFIGPYKFWYESDEDRFKFEDFYVYNRFRAYRLYYKGEEDYIVCDEGYNEFCDLATRQIGLVKLTSVN